MCKHMKCVAEDSTEHMSVNLRKPVLCTRKIVRLQNVIAFCLHSVLQQKFTTYAEISEDFNKTYKFCVAYTE